MSTSMSNPSSSNPVDAKTAISVIPPTPPTAPACPLPQQQPQPLPLNALGRALPVSAQPAINLSYIPRRPTGQIVQIPFTPSTCSQSTGSVSPRSAAPANSPANSSVADSIDVSPLPTDAASYARSSSSSLVHRPRVQASAGPRPPRVPSPQSYSANNPPRALPMDLTPCDCPMCQPTRFDTTSLHSASVDSFPVNSSIPECDCGCEYEAREHVTASVAASLSSPVPQRLHPSISVTSGEGLSVHSADSSHSSTSSSSETHGVLVTSSLSMDKLALHQRLASLDFERRQHALLHAQSPQQRPHSRGSSLHNMTAATAALLCISAARERINEEEEEASPSLSLSQQQPPQPLFAADDCDLHTMYRNATVVPQPNQPTGDSEASPSNNPSFPVFDRPSDLLVRRRFSDSGLLVHTNAAAAAAIAARLRLRAHAAPSGEEESLEDGECTCGGQSPSFNPADSTNANTTVNNTRAPSPSEHGGMRSYVASVSTSPCGRFGVESADVSRRTSPSANAPLGSSRVAPPAPSSSSRKVFTFDGPLVSFYEDLEKKQQEQLQITEESLDLSKTPPTGDSFNPIYAYGSPGTRKSDKTGGPAPGRHVRELSRVTECSGVSSDKQCAEEQWAVRLRPPVPDSKSASKEFLGVPSPFSTHDHTTPNAAECADGSDATWHRVQPPAEPSEQQRTNYTYLTGMDQHDWSLLVKMYRNMPPTV